MKLLFFNASTNIGGIETVLLTYASGLSKMEQDVYYVSCWDQGDFENVLPQGVCFVGLGNVRLRYSLFRLRHILKEIHPDVIITANDSTLIAYLASFSIGFKIKIVTSQHSYLDNSDTLFYSKLIVKYIFPKCDMVIAVSDGISEMLKGRCKIKWSRIEVLNNPINIDRIVVLSNEYSINVNKEYFVYVGRMTSVKNLKFLIDSYNCFRNRYGDYSLVLVGDGPDRSFVEEYAHTSTYSSSIIFTGKKSNPYPYIKNAKLLLLSSTSEAFPTVLIEAMAMGVTCVSTPTKGGRDILKDGKIGYLSKDSKDYEEYASLLDVASKNAFDKEILMQSVKSRFGLNHIAERFLNILNGL